MKALIVLAAMSLAACATKPSEPVVKIVEVKVAIPISCISDKLPAPKPYPDEDAALKAAGGAADRYQLIAAGRLLRKQRLAEVEPAIAACRKPDPG